VATDLSVHGKDIWRNRMEQSEKFAKLPKGLKLIAIASWPMNADR
jgi:hypothetical protein